MSQQNISFSSDELDITSSKLLPLILYPRFSEKQYKERIGEMELLGVKSIILNGKAIVNGIHIAGKGCVGIVVKARVGNIVRALKIRRTDAVRQSMYEEARLQKIANNTGVGPMIEGHTKNFIAMEFIPGESIINWIGKSPARCKTRSIARDVLEQCFRLDTVGLDHGELSRIARHIIVSDRPRIIDFESASAIRKTSNVTSASQSMFLHGTVANGVKNILGNSDTEKVMVRLKAYKSSHTRDNFDALLDSLSL